MAFNERGEWYLPDPIENYANAVLKSMQEPGSGSYLWTDEYRRQLHNEAAKFLLERDGLPLTSENLNFARHRVTEEIRIGYHPIIEQAHSTISLPAQISQTPLYKRVGD